MISFNHCRLRACCSLLLTCFGATVTSANNISDARKRANDKWRDKFDEIRFRVPKGKKAVIQQYAAQRGESLNALLNRAVVKVMKEESANKDGVEEAKE